MKKDWKKRENERDKEKERRERSSSRHIQRWLLYTGLG
jgi:hypothetical protein